MPRGQSTNDACRDVDKFDKRERKPIKKDKYALDNLHRFHGRVALLLYSCPVTTDYNKHGCSGVGPRRTIDVHLAMHADGSLFSVRELARHIKETTWTRSTADELTQTFSNVVVS